MSDGIVMTLVYYSMVLKIIGFVVGFIILIPLGIVILVKYHRGLPKDD